MKFDVMAKMVERHVPEFIPTMRVASLIEAPTYNPETMASTNMQEEFRLPWNAVFIEDSQSGVLIQRRGRMINEGNGWRPDPDKEKRWTTADIGIERMDLFRFGVVFSKGAFKNVDLPADSGLFAEMFVEEVVAWDGSGATFAKGDHRPGTQIRWVMGGIMFVVGDRTLELIPGTDGFDSSSRSLVDNVMAALSQCCMVTRPSNWIVKRVPTASEAQAIARRANHAVKVPRSHERDRWLLITDAERARAFREPAAIGVSGDAREHRDVAPHPRRAHYRHIGTNEDGSKRHTWVRACWVGSKEAEIRGARYRVELDL